MEGEPKLIALIHIVDSLPVCAGGAAPRSRASVLGCSNELYLRALGQVASENFAHDNLEKGFKIVLLLRIHVYSVIGWFNVQGTHTGWAGVQWALGTMLFNAPHINMVRLR